MVTQVKRSDAVGRASREYGHLDEFLKHFLMSTTAEEEAEIETLLAGVASSIMPAMPGDAAAADAQRQQQKQQRHAQGATAAGGDSMK